MGGGEEGEIVNLKYLDNAAITTSLQTRLQSRTI